MSSSGVVERTVVARVSRENDLAVVARALAEGRRTGQPPVIDLTPVLTGSKRPKSELVEWLWNLLQVEYSDLPVTLVVSRLAVPQAYRNGLVSAALLRRLNSTKILVESEESLFPDERLDMSSPRSGLLPNVVGSQFTLHDPHVNWSGMSPKRFEDAVATAIDLCARDAGISRQDEWLSQTGSVASAVLVHLLDNIRAHAFSPVPGLEEGLTPQRVHSFVRGVVTKGGGVESFNRLRLSIGDFGFGLIRSLRPKLAVVDPAYRTLDGVRIVRRLLNASLPPYGRADNVFGYPEILKIVSMNGGHIAITTEDDLSEGTTITRRTVQGTNGQFYKRNRTEGKTVGNRDLPFSGTAVQVTIPIPTVV